MGAVKQDFMDLQLREDALIEQVKALVVDYGIARIEKEIDKIEEKLLDE